MTTHLQAADNMTISVGNRLALVLIPCAAHLNVLRACVAQPRVQAKVTRPRLDHRLHQFPARQFGSPQLLGALMSVVLQSTAPGSNIATQRRQRVREVCILAFAPIQKLGCRRPRQRIEVRKLGSCEHPLMHARCV